MPPPQAILLIADISGFTGFMRSHAVASSHAKPIIVRLLKALIKASSPPLQLAEIEGDAVFFFATATKENVEAVAAQVKEQVLNLFVRFNQEVEVLQQIQRCECEAYSNVGALKRKQVLHTGDVAIEQIDRFEKLFGLDVIVVHRMLKNSVPASEYVMMTDPVYNAFGNFYELEPERRSEQFEGIGTVDTLVFYASPRLLTQLHKTPAAPTPTRREALRWSLKLYLRSMVDRVRAYLSRSLPGQT